MVWVRCLYSIHFGGNSQSCLTDWAQWKYVLFKQTYVTLQTHAVLFDVFWLEEHFLHVYKFVVKTRIFCSGAFIASFFLLIWIFSTLNLGFPWFSNQIPITWTLGSPGFCTELKYRNIEKIHKLGFFSKKTLECFKCYTWFFSMLAQKMANIWDVERRISSKGPKAESF